LLDTARHARWVTGRRRRRPRRKSEDGRHRVMYVMSIQGFVISGSRNSSSRSSSSTGCESFQKDLFGQSTALSPGTPVTLQAAGETMQGGSKPQASLLLLDAPQRL
jgi:hypothetical protein